MNTVIEGKNIIMKAFVAKNVYKFMIGANLSKICGMVRGYKVIYEAE